MWGYQWIGCDDDGSAGLAPYARGGQLDRWNDLFVGCTDAGAQARTVRITEIVALSDRRPAVPDSGLGCDHHFLAHRLSVTTPAGDSDHESIGMADDPKRQAGTRGDPSSLDPGPRSHHWAPCRTDTTDPHGEPNQLRSRHGRMVPLDRSRLARSYAGCFACRGHACADLGGLSGLFCLSG